MTAQIEDKVFFRGCEYSLIGINGGDLFSPEQYGMQPEMIHTACYRGFMPKYELTEQCLYLRELALREKDNNYRPIGGVVPENNSYTGFYTGLDVLIPFTGKIRLAKDLISEFYIHMGYQKATAFETVLDITLEDGRLVEVKDRSEEIKMKRGAFKKSHESGRMERMIEEPFSLDMDLE
jgi:hypothetical protein